MCDGVDYYTDSQPSDWDYQDGSVRHRCVVCREMFVGDPDDDPPICDSCWFDESELGGGK